jgi:uncharacterized protein (DUF1697 family)
MTTCVALLRGINVGGKHSLPMQTLRDILAALDCEDAKTYIQSGNAVFNFDKDRQELAAEITAAIEREVGFAPSVQMFKIEDFQAILNANPFPDAVAEPKTLHIAFLAETPTAPDLAAIAALQSDTEETQLSDGAFFLHAPDGIGRSKLAAKLDKCLGVETTGRNWRSATAIADLAATIIS